MRKKIANILRKPITSSLIAVIMGFLIGGIVLAIAGYNPFEAYKIMFLGMVKKPKYISQIIINAVPIVLTGLSVAFAYNTGLFNIGAEGQYMVGTLMAVIFGTLTPMPKIIHPIVILLIAFLAGGCFGGFAGWLKTRFGIHEVISTIMLNWIAFYLYNFILNLPSIKKEGTQASNELLETARIRLFSGFNRTAEGKEFIKNHAILGDFLKTDLNMGIIIAIVMVIFAWWFLNRTKRGFELRAVGSSPAAAEFAGINVKQNTIIAMFVSGAIAAIAGAMQIMGTGGFRASILSMQEGYGWDGISVSLLANNNPLGVLLSGTMFSGLKYGAVSIQSELGASSEIIDIIIGTIVFCVALSSVFPMIADKLEEGDVK